MIGYLLKRPIAVFTIFFCIGITGVVAYVKLPVALMPDLESPKMVVKAVYNGFGANYIEDNVLSVMRNQLAGLYGLEDVESISANNTGQINLKFAYGTDMKLAFIEANEKIDQSTSMLPADLERPQVFRVSDTDIPILKLQIQSANMSPAELSELSTYVIKRRIEGIPGVAKVSIGGDISELISVAPRSTAMKRYKVSESDLISTLEEANFSQLQIKVKEGIYEYNVRIENPLKSIEDIRNLNVMIDERAIKVGRLAEVSYQEEEPNGIHWYNGQRGIVIDVHRQTSANMRSLNEQLQATIIDLKEEFPQLNFHMSQNQTGLLNMSISQLTSSLILGGVLSFLILFIFSANYKLPLLMGAIIPVTLLLTFAFFYLLDLSLNIITLSGLILGVGMLIDNAIILLDNIHVYREKGISLFESCRRGAEEVFSALLSSTFTTLSVFLPLVFLGGIGGVFFGAQALSLGAMLCASLVVAFLLLPVLYLKLAPKSQQDSSRMYGWVLMQYERSHAFKKIILTALIALVVLGGIVSFILPVSNLPELHTSSARLELIWPDPINVTENERRARELVSLFDSTLTDAELDIGILELDPANATFINSLTAFFSFTDYEAKSRNMEILEKHLSSEYPNVVFEVSRARNPFDQLFQQSESDLSVKLRMETSENLGVRDFDALQKDQQLSFGQGFVRQKGLFLNLKQERLDRINVTPKSLVDQVAYYFQDQVVTEIQRVDRKETIQLQHASNADIRSVNQIVLSDDSTKSRYPVSYFFDLEEISLPQFITSDLAGPYQSIDYLASTGQEEWMFSIRDLIGNRSVIAEFSGEYFNRKENLRDLMISLLLAILLLYFILAAQFESLKQPLIILITLPVALSGSVIALFCFGYSLNISSMIGMIVTLGIIVNDSILKIDTINRMRSEGMSLDQAVVQAGVLRLKPILMTSLTTILALIPLLFSEGMGADLQAPLAATVVGGLLVGTICSIYMIPSLYRKVS